MTALRTEYEDAVIDAIKLALLAETLPSGATGGYLKLVTRYNGPLNPTEDNAALKRLLENGTPSLGVVTGDGEYDEITVRRRKGTLETSLELLLCSANLRDHESHLTGDGVDNDPGIYQTIEDIRAILFGEELDIDGAGFANPRSEGAILRTQHLTVWRLTYDLKMDALRPAPDADADDYLTMRTLINQADDATADPITTSDRDITP
jgi:hypothetical protein